MTDQRPNLVFVLADQLRRQSVGYAGDALARTPNIDALALGATSYEQAVATSPVCAGMRASMLTGTYPTTTGMAINELRLNPNQRCIGHVLTDGGYDTAYLGKWHLYANQLGNHGDPKNSFVPPGPHRLGFDGYWAAYNFHHRYFEAWYHRDTADRQTFAPGVYEPDGQTDLAIRYVTEHAQKARPFALFLSWGPPHDPWDDGNVPEADRALFEDVDFADPPNYLPDDDPYGDFWSRLSPADRVDLPAWRRNYYAMTHNLDRNLGRLVNAIDDLGLTESTLVIFSSDHGEMLGAHGRRAKNTFYEEAVRVPFLIRWPGEVATGATTDVSFGTVDIAPTLSSLLGLEAAESWEGTDLSGPATGAEVDADDVALLQGLGPVALFADGCEWRAVRSAQHTYARYLVDGAEHLYDNIADPHQMNNLATDPAHATLCSTMREKLAVRLANIEDDFLPSTAYETAWTDGDRNIVAGARGRFPSMPLEG